MRVLFTAIWNFLKTLNRSKVVNGVGAFFALAIPVLVVVGQNLPASWKVTLLVASAVGVLSRLQYVFQKIIPLLDGSSVVQIKPPTSAGQASLVSVAVDPSQVAPGPGVVSTGIDRSEDITGVAKSRYSKPATPTNPTKT
jgi:hypothetical protein